MFRPVPIDEQIAEVEREIALRERVYPNWVAKGRMNQARADEAMARIRAALTTLRYMREHRSTIIAAVKAEQEAMQ